MHLEYEKLKGFVETEGPRKRTVTRTPQFVELMASAAAGFSECIIELEGEHGKMRIHGKGMTASDLAQTSFSLKDKVTSRTSTKSDSSRRKSSITLSEPLRARLAEVHDT